MVSEVSDQKKRDLITAVLVNLFFAFTVLFFIPFELYTANRRELRFTMGDVLIVMGSVGIIYMIIATLFCYAAKQGANQIFLSLVFSFTLACYLQGNYFNPPLPKLDGTRYELTEHMGHAVLDILLWAAVFLIPLILWKLARGKWKTVLRTVSLAAILMQATALIYLTATTNYSVTVKSMTTEKVFELSEDTNVVYFILDTFDSDFVSNIYRDEANFFAPLDGFIYYGNSISRFERTKPAIPYLLTEIPYMNDVPYEKYIENAWDAVYSNRSMLGDLHRDGFDIRILTEPTFFGEKALELIDNASSQYGKVSPAGLFFGMMKLSAFRMMPDMAKNYFWFYTDELNKKAVGRDGGYTSYKEYDNGNEEYLYDDPRFYKDLQENGVTAKSEKKCFRMYHLNGTHPPYHMNEKAEYVKDQVTYLEQSKGSMQIVYEYLKQMKEQGVYDNSLIIITADHGGRRGDGVLEYPMCPILFVKPIGKAGWEGNKTSYAPVDQGDYHNTIMSQLGYEGDLYGGENVFNLKEYEARDRYFYFPLDTTPDMGFKGSFYIQQYKISGESYYFRNWTKTDVFWERKYE